jgi:hypothetical protein
MSSCHWATSPTASSAHSETHRLLFVKSCSMTHTRKDLWAYVIICSVFLLLAAISVVSEWDRLEGALFTKPSDYRLAQGEILSSSVRSKGGRGGYEYQISYSYIAEGKRYVDNQVTFSSASRSYRSYAQGYVRNYPVGLSVLVYYHHKKPSFAVLEPNQKEGTAMITFGRCVLLICSLLGVAYSLFLLTRQRATS